MSEGWVSPIGWCLLSRCFLSVSGESESLTGGRRLGVRSLARGQSREQHGGTTKSGGRQPAVVFVNPRLQLQRDEFPRFAFASNAPHGGLTPPALLLPCECPPTKNRFLRCTYACPQERRASACRAFGRSNDVRDFSQITCKCVPHITAGLRQPLLIAPRTFGAEYDILDVQTHVHKSGGRQPAVVGKPNAVRRKSPTIRRRCDGRPQERRA